MKKLLASTCGGLAVAAITLTGCNDGGNDSAKSPASPSASSSTTTSPSPSASPSAEASDDAITSDSIVGDWEAPAARWVVHFRDDGTFVEDFEGVTDFRTGDFSVDGDTVTLVGGDGNSTEGAVEGESISFDLGTLSRQ